MLLRRVIHHVKAQNWTAVALDFFIVVVGVFIGIQVSNWNEERLAVKSREATIDRLHAEAEATALFLRRTYERFEQGISMRSSVLEKAANGELDLIEQREIVLAVNYVQFFPPVAPPRSVYDEIISSGRYTEIGDQEARDAINKYYSQLDQLSSLVSYVRLVAVDMAVWRHPSVAKNFDPNNLPFQTQTIVDIEMALGDPQFLKTLQVAHSMQTELLVAWAHTLETAEQMCREIARLSRRPCVSLDQGENKQQSSDAS